MVKSLSDNAAADKAGGLKVKIPIGKPCSYGSASSTMFQSQIIDGDGLAKVKKEKKEKKPKKEKNKKEKTVRCRCFERIPHSFSASCLLS